MAAEEAEGFWDEVRATMGASAREALRAELTRLDGSTRDGLGPDEYWDDVVEISATRPPAR